MQKFFSANLDPSSSKIIVGESSLSGMYACNYCGEACAQLARFQVWTKSGEKGNFCVPECAVAYIVHKCVQFTPEEKTLMKNMVEQKAKRPVSEAPPPSALFRYNKINGFKREYWLDICRQSLNADYTETATKELFIQKLDLDQGVIKGR